MGINSARRSPVLVKEGPKKHELASRQINEDSDHLNYPTCTGYQVVRTCGIPSSNTVIQLKATSSVFKAHPLKKDEDLLHFC